MPTLTLNFSLKPRSKVNVYADGKLCKTVSSGEQARLDLTEGKHSLRLVQFRGKKEDSASSFGAVPYFGGGTSLNGDGTKSAHILPWRATVYHCECEFDVTLSGDASVAVLSTVEKERGFIGIDNSFISLKIGSADGVDVENVTLSTVDGETENRFNMYQRMILLLTYIPLFLIIVWQTAVAIIHWNEPALFMLHGKFSILLPIVLTVIMLARIIHFLRKIK